MSENQNRLSCINGRENILNATITSNAQEAHKKKKPIVFLVICVTFQKCNLYSSEFLSSSSSSSLLFLLSSSSFSIFFLSFSVVICFSLVVCWSGCYQIIVFLLNYCTIFFPRKPIKFTLELDKLKQLNGKNEQ